MTPPGTSGVLRSTHHVTIRAIDEDRIFRCGVEMDMGVVKARHYTSPLQIDDFGARTDALCNLLCGSDCRNPIGSHGDRFRLGRVRVLRPDFAMYQRQIAGTIICGQAQGSRNESKG